MLDTLFLRPSLRFTTLAPATLHSTSLHLSTLHFLAVKLHPTTLHLLVIFIIPILNVSDKIWLSDNLKYNPFGIIVLKWCFITFVNYSSDKSVTGMCYLLIALISCKYERKERVLIGLN
jgi:hypothetical protein